jgi:UDP-glucuronate 4-epimerase
VILKRIFVTGTAGFIGFHLANLLLSQGYRVHGYDGMTDYYDVSLKLRRNQLLERSDQFSATQGMLEDEAKLNEVVNEFQPDVIVHLAGQAGVRYSLENPRAYLDSNVIGTLNVMELARHLKVNHLLMASTSSVYGANSEMPFVETEKADKQLTIYASTKKANESMAHAYSHIYGIPTTMFRFFTVYGTWGRPDLALYKFVDAILDGRPIDIYNHGKMYRDFTYVDDLVYAISLLIDVIPKRPADGNVPPGDSLSPVAPHRVVNIGNGEKVKLLDFIDAIEDCLGQKAERNYMNMQTGDVPATWANADLLYKLTGYRPRTDFRDGIIKFVEWYREYSGK